MKRITDYFKHPIRQGLISSGLLALVIMFLGGLGFWWIDPRVNSFGDGLWLAFTTAATVGYGDHVPSTQASRAFAVVVVVLGLAVLSLVVHMSMMTLLSSIFSPSLNAPKISTPA